MSGAPWEGFAIEDIGLKWYKFGTLESLVETPDFASNMRRYPGSGLFWIRQFGEGRLDP